MPGLFSYDAFARTQEPALSRRRLAALFRSHGVDTDGLRWREHPRSGRNRLLLVEAGDGRTWIVKQSTTGSRAEAWFYARAAGGFGAAPACLFSEPDAGVVAIEYRQAASTLHERALAEPASALEALPRLGSVLARLHGLEPGPASAPEASPPFPFLDPIDVRFWIDATPAAREVVAGVQDSPALSGIYQEAAQGAGPVGLVHGDLKLDNVLHLPAARHPARLEVIDWECCGCGPIAWDLGAVLGSMVLPWSDRWTRGLNGTDRSGQPGPGMTELAAAARRFMRGYVEEAGRAGFAPPDRGTVLRYAAAWMVGRTWTEATFRHLPSPVHPVRLLVAESLAGDPDRLFENMRW